jgi:hypothetical protein
VHQQRRPRLVHREAGVPETAAPAETAAAAHVFQRRWSWVGDVGRTWDGWTAARIESWSPPPPPAGCSSATLGGAVDWVGLDRDSLQSKPRHTSLYIVYKYILYIWSDFI